jgi:AGZA family xanthine/uracil permease-like MFS transporter
MASFASKWSKGSKSLNNAVARSAVGRYFKLDGSGHPLAREGSVFTRELRAGLVTFTAMAYSKWRSPV